MDSAGQLRTRLLDLGLSESAVTAAWPAWWSNEADQSEAARAELSFGVARRLGLDPRSLLRADEPPRFLWREEARFKHLAGEEMVERAGITSFGRAVATAMVQAAPAPRPIEGSSPAALREALLGRGRPFVALADLLAFTWSVGIPVVHLRVFPWPQKRMAAMAVAVGTRASILIGRDSTYPAKLAFYLAHELGHLALGHLAPDEQIIDLDEGEPTENPEDDEELEADAFALELLTGESKPIVLPDAGVRPSAASLAEVAIRAAGDLAIEPGTLALCFGFSTADWAVANAALGQIYPDASPVWEGINEIAQQQLALDVLQPETADFLTAVMGAV